jgi:hypothetical protein
MGKLPPELAAVARSRQKVDRLEAAWRAAIRERVKLCRTAKQAGHPAATVYQLAGIGQSTYSRQAKASGE